MNLVDILQMNPEQSRSYFEKIRWPNGPVCPRQIERSQPHEVYKVNGGRAGLYECRHCRRKKLSAQFTVTVGTIFEDSHLPLNKWLGAFYLMCSSKKGISANQLHRALGISYKSAWFMAHRIRYVFRTRYPKGDKLKGIVEADETYVGGKSKMEDGRDNKYPVLALVERKGNVRAKALDRVTTLNIRDAVLKHVDTDSILMTDQHKGYVYPGRIFKKHYAVNHSIKEYARRVPEGSAHCNTAESFFALLKRGVYGTFHHVSGKHLHRYADEFSFRFNNRLKPDNETCDLALKKSEGKRLTYKNRITHEFGQSR